MSWSSICIGASSLYDILGSKLPFTIQKKIKGDKNSEISSREEK
jgi:hypothetical protein